MRPNPPRISAFVAHVTSTEERIGPNWFNIRVVSRRTCPCRTHGAPTRAAGGGGRRNTHKKNTAKSEKEFKLRRVMSFSLGAADHAGYDCEQIHDGGQPLLSADTCTSPTNHSNCPALCTTKCISAHACSSHKSCDDSWEEIQSKRTIRAENEVEANKLVNNYRFGFRKWKSHVTERPFEDRSEVVKELYSELNVIKPHSGHLITCGNVVYVFLFGWWVSLAYFLVGTLMFITLTGVPYGKLCWKLSRFFMWPFGKSIHEIGNTLRRCCEQTPDCECSIDGLEETSPILLPSPTEVPVSEIPSRPQCTPFWRRFSTYVWLLLGYPPLVVVHSLACFFAWVLIFTIPVSKMNARTLGVILLLPPEDVSVSSCSHRKHQAYETRALLCCYHAVNWYYYKYTVDGINVFAVNLLPLVIVAIVIGYIDKENQYASSDVKFAIAICSIIPLSYYIGMGIASISAQSNFAVGAVVNATFGSITELTFYITALIRGHQTAKPCLQEVVKSALTGTLLGCILFIPYFIGVTVLAMVPEIPEIVNGIQFALQNNISLSLEVGSCIAVQVCMLQIPILVLFNAFYDVGFVLLFSDLHLWASMFSVIVVNYIFMDGKSDYFQGTALVVVYLILLALYYFAPFPAGC
ncbi:hypothetical protein F2P81_007155 [Scophthalmus maximus]|uniref:Cation exchanger C521.04c n=1 Tax=Scophthalmus maximus TaxID=52904 RepID=A0A6A4T4W3_SCOMX|nr:hypothetical protein F2P81_007155 [Scophthalmus maximus]